MKHIHKKIASNCYLLKQIKKYLPLKTGKLPYNSYVLPHLDCCSIIWGKTVPKPPWPNSIKYKRELLTVPDSFIIIIIIVIIIIIIDHSYKAQDHTKEFQCAVH